MHQLLEEEESSLRLMGAVRQDGHQLQSGPHVLVGGWRRTNHSSYLSQPPQPAVVYFFLAGVLFSIENAKCWPNLANFDQFWLFCREFTEFFGVLFIDLNNAAVY